MMKLYLIQIHFRQHFNLNTAAATWHISVCVHIILSTSQYGTVISPVHVKSFGCFLFFEMHTHNLSSHNVFLFMQISTCIVKKNTIYVLLLFILKYISFVQVTKTQTSTPPRVPTHTESGGERAHCKQLQCDVWRKTRVQTGMQHLPHLQRNL